MVMPKTRMVPIDSLESPKTTGEKIDYSMANSLFNIKQSSRGLWSRLFSFRKKREEKMTASDPNFLMKWTSQPLKESLTMAARKDKTFILELDETIRVTLSGKEVSFSQINSKILQCGLFERQGNLRDEIYLQIIRQINGNPDLKAVEMGWKLMICVSATFPPSKRNLEFIMNWMHLNCAPERRLSCCFAHLSTVDLSSSTHKSRYNQLELFRKCCKGNLTVFNHIGPRGHSPDDEDVEFLFERRFKCPVLFGVELKEIYEQEGLLCNYYNQKVPKLMMQLLELIRSRNGFKREGIFRISGDLQQVFQLSQQLVQESFDQNHADFVKDAAVPSSTLKLWMRTLASPLIPAELHSDSSPALKDLLETQLPKPNLEVITCLMKFLQELSLPEHQDHTKMSLDNLCMIFAPCLMRTDLRADPLEVLRQSAAERKLVREIFDYFLLKAKKEKEGDGNGEGEEKEKESGQEEN